MEVVLCEKVSLKDFAKNYDYADIVLTDVEIEGLFAVLKLDYVYNPIKNICYMRE